mmetsp:Transcript_29469/g.77505  ORF Transcript_29469/g.77505 Transcript_29469/m.77505 type:complete len:256 (+) Transcript_29469:233-1000(+)
MSRCAHTCGQTQGQRAGGRSLALLAMGLNVVVRRGVCSRLEDEPQARSSLWANRAERGGVDTVFAGVPPAAVPHRQHEFSVPGMPFARLEFSVCTGLYLGCLVPDGGVSRVRGAHAHGRLHDSAARAAPPAQSPKALEHHAGAHAEAHQRDRAVALQSGESKMVLLFVRLFLGGGTGGRYVKELRTRRRARRVRWLARKVGSSDSSRELHLPHVVSGDEKNVEKHAAEEPKPREWLSVHLFGGSATPQEKLWPRG